MGKTMIVAGIDIGAATAKSVLLNEKNMISRSVLPTGPDVEKISKTVTEKALHQAGLGWNDIRYVVSTGYGRNAVPFAHKTITEIYCHARGAKWLFPESEMLIDIGGQDSKAVEIGPEGSVTDFLMNDKCAAGTGRFLEVMANVLEIPLEELGAISLESTDPCRISSVCTIFAETEVVSLRAQKTPVKDIVAGIHKAVAKRVVTMAARLGRHDAVVFTGGVAKNIGLTKALEEELGVKLIIPKEPQIIGALGAAILASQMVEGQ